HPPPQAGRFANVNALRFADTVFTSGRVLTFDDASTVADAIAVTGDRIAGVGSDKSVLALAGPETRVVALSGRTVIPGIIDAHAHMEREGLKQLRLSLAGLATVREVLQRLAEEAKRRRKGQWIVT